MKRVVIALGGNALGNNPKEQLELVTKTSESIADMVESGVDVIIGHGNGPQVGMVNLAFDTSNKATEGKSPEMPLPECGAMTQGYIGYHLQQAIINAFNRRGIKKSVVSLVTQVEVDQKDPSFKNPSKPIGSFYSEDEAKKLASSQGWEVKEDAGRGWRRVVASPKPKAIVESEAIKTLVAQGTVVITVGGGGIPVIKKSQGYEGVPSVIDKDFACEKLAETVDADAFIVLTAVDYVSINYGKENQEDLKQVKVSELEKHIVDKQFAPGSMLPKVEAAIQFANSKEGRKAIITDLKNAKDAIKETIGTIITK